VAALIGAGLGLAAVGLVAYWALVLSEGVYLGPRVVIWLYDRVAPRYDRIKNSDHADDSRWLARPLLVALDRCGAPRVLDVATGTGRLPGALVAEADFQGRVAGVDRSRGMLAQAERRLAGHGAAGLVRADAGRLPFADETFDAVACVEALEFTQQPRETLREMVRVLRPGGVLLVSNRVGWDALAYPGRLCGRGRLERALAGMGLEVVESERWQVYYDLVWGRKRNA